MLITPLFVAPVDGQTQPPHMSSNLSVSIRRTKNGAQVNVSGPVGPPEEYSIERQVGETDQELAARTKAIITNSIEV